MPASDSDSDDFFSDLRAFRSTLGLSRAARAGVSSPGGPSPAQPAKRPGTPTRPTPRPHKRHSTGSPAPERGSRSSAAAKLGGVSPGEIAALLSPRRPPQRKSTRPGSGSGDNGSQSTRHDDAVGRRASLPASPRSIPPRTPESRLASPLAILQQPRKQPATPSPTVHRRPGSPGTLTAAATASPLSVRSLWDRAEASPAVTPARRRTRRASPLDTPKQTPEALARGLARGVGSVRLGVTADHGGLLGKVEDALVTEDDIDAARRKIGQEQTLTQQQILREVRERLVSFAGSVDDAAMVRPWLDSATLLSQFHTFGHGRLSYTAHEVVWRGEMLGPIATLAQSMDGGLHGSIDGGAALDTTLVFPWPRVSGVCAKSVDDADLLMTTVDEDLGIAFQVAHWDAATGGAVGLAEDMNRQLRHALAARSSQAQDRGASGAGLGGLLEPPPMHDLICALLRAAASHDAQHAGLDIPGALHDEGFVAKAVSMVSSLGLQLAQEAQRVCGSLERDTSPGAGAGHTVPPKTCTLCYAEEESIELAPCGHRLCGECLEHLLRLYPTSSQKTDDPTVACACPWDRCHISSWSDI